MKGLEVAYSTDKNQKDSVVQVAVQSLLLQEGQEVDQLKAPRKFNVDKQIIDRDEQLPEDLLLFKRIVSSPIDDLDLQDDVEQTSFA
mmetsp:Transcript_18162/g.27948  ORF Transcript_18162/g.27948 Transcript_18162/m.27948 type:complete len:87 (+) Transcript_18162:3318-3578(+)